MNNEHWITPVGFAGRQNLAGIAQMAMPFAFVADCLDELAMRLDLREQALVDINEHVTQLDKGLAEALDHIGALQSHLLVLDKATPIPEKHAPLVKEIERESAAMKSLGAKIQFLVDYLQELGHLEEGVFAFPDGEHWTATNTNKQERADKFLKALEKDEIHEALEQERYENVDDSDD